MTVSRALVVGASGQDGTYLVRDLLARGIDVTATGRTLGEQVPANWLKVGLGPRATRRSLDPLDPSAVNDLLEKVSPDAVFVLSGQSSVRRSFEAPAMTMRSHVEPLLNVLEFMRRRACRASVVFSASTDCFGSIAPGARGNEQTPFDPRSPYGIAKCAGAQLVISYRRHFDVRCANAFLSNHESALRGPDFLFGQLLRGIADVRAGLRDRIETGSLTIVRDWGWAPDYAAALVAMASLPQPVDLVIATGRSVLLREAADALLAAAGLDPARHLAEQHSGQPPNQIDRQAWDPAAAEAAIGWNRSTAFPQLAELLLGDWERFDGDATTFASSMS